MGQKVFKFIAVAMVICFTSSIGFAADFTRKNVAPLFADDNAQLEFDSTTVGDNDNATVLLYDDELVLDQTNSQSGYDFVTTGGFDIVFDNSGGTEFDLEEIANGGFVRLFNTDDNEFSSYVREGDDNKEDLTDGSVAIYTQGGFGGIASNNDQAGIIDLVFFVLNSNVQAGDITPGDFSIEDDAGSDNPDVGAKYTDGSGVTDDNPFIIQLETDDDAEEVVPGGTHSVDQDDAILDTADNESESNVTLGSLFNLAGAAGDAMDPAFDKWYLYRAANKGTPTFRIDFETGDVEKVPAYIVNDSATQTFEIAIDEDVVYNEDGDIADDFIASIDNGALSDPATFLGPFSIGLTSATGVYTVFTSSDASASVRVVFLTDGTALVFDDDFAPTSIADALAAAQDEDDANHEDYFGRLDANAFELNVQQDTVMALDRADGNDEIDDEGPDTEMAAPFIVEVLVDTGAPTSGYVRTITIAFSEELDGTDLEAGDFDLFYDEDEDGVLDAGEVILGADAIDSIALADVSDVVEGDDAIVLTLNDAQIKSDASHIGVRIQADVGLSEIAEDDNNNFFDPFLAPMELDPVRHYLFDTSISADDVDAASYDYVSTWPDFINIDDDSEFGIRLLTDNAQSAPISAEIVGGTVRLTWSEEVTINDFDAGDADSVDAERLFVIKNADGEKINFQGTLERANDAWAAQANIDGAASKYWVITIDASDEVVAEGGTIYVWAYPSNDDEAIDDGEDNFTVETAEIALTGAVVADPLPVKDSVLLVDTDDDEFYDQAELKFKGADDSEITLALVKKAAGESTWTKITDMTELKNLFDIFSVTSYDLTPTAATMSGDTVTLTMPKVSQTLNGPGFVYLKDLGTGYINDDGDEFALANDLDPDADTVQVAEQTWLSIEYPNIDGIELRDTNSDGFADTLAIIFGIDLDEEGTEISNEGFSLSTVASDDVIAGSPITLVGTTASVVDTDDDESEVLLTIDPMAFPSTEFGGTWGDTEENGATQRVWLTTGVDGYVLCSYNGDDLNDEAGQVPAFFITGGDDAMPPVPMAENTDGDKTEYNADGDEISIALSEALPAADENNEEAAFYFVFLDADGFVVDTSNWLINDAGADDTIGIDNISSVDTIAAKLYLSQANGVNELDDADGNELDLQYDNLLMTGTTVPIGKVDFPTILKAYTFMQSGYYKYIYVKFSEAVTQADALATGAMQLANSFRVILNFDTNDNDDNFQTLKPVAISGAGTEWLLEVPHTNDEGTNADLGVRPIKLQYIDNSSSDGYDFLQDADENELQSATVDVDWYGLDSEDRTADVQSVEIWGELLNFDFTGAEVIAYEAYKSVSTTKRYDLTVTFDYGPLAAKTKGAFGIQANGATDQCHQNGSYITLVYTDNKCDENEFVSNYSDIDPLTGGSQDIADFVAQGYFYLHTDIESNSQNADEGYSGEAPNGVDEDVNSGFVMGISLDPTPQGEHDSVFYVKLNTNDRNKTLAVVGNYGITGSGSWIEVATTCWDIYSEVGKDIIDFGHETKEFKIVARDKIGIGAAQAKACDECVEDYDWYSTILEKKVVLVLKQVTPANDDPTTVADEAVTYTLLNGVTDDVDIDYNFWNYDGSLNIDFDAETIFSHTVYGEQWTLFPLLVDKAYVKGKASVQTATTYPSGAKRATAKISVDSISEALIGLDSSGEPIFPFCEDCNSGTGQLVFGLDEQGVAFGSPKDVNYMKGGMAYALYGDDYIKIHTFGYMMPNETQGVGAKLLGNVLDTEDKSARSAKNLGWNLIANLADEALGLEEAGPTTLTDYVITFKYGWFKSWIKDGSLNDFDSASEDTGYFVHTANP